MNHLREFWVTQSPEFITPGYSPEQVAYHARLLLKGGYVTGDSRKPSISGLTWEGHEFLDSIKDTGVWETTKERLSGLPNVTLLISRTLICFPERFLEVRNDEGSGDYKLRGDGDGAVVDSPGAGSPQQLGVLCNESHHHQGRRQGIQMDQPACLG